VTNGNSAFNRCTIRKASSSRLIQTGNHLSPPCSRRMQDVESSSVAAVDLEVERARGIDHLYIGIDDGNIVVAREQELACDLPDAAEANDQRGAFEPLGAFVTFSGRLLSAANEAQGRETKRREHHRKIMMAVRIASNTRVRV